MRDPSVVAALVNLVNAVLVIGVARLCWIRREMAAARFMFGMMVAILLWVSFGVPEALDTVPDRKQLWSAFQYLGITTTACWFLLFSLEYANLSPRLPRILKALLFVPPGIICLLAFTNRFHHLVWTHVTLQRGNLLHYAHGPAYWFGLIGYSYLLFLIANLLMLYAIHSLSHHYRKKGVLLGASAFMPFLASLAYNLDWCPPGVDPTPIGLTLAGTGLYFGIVRRHLLELVPVARHVLVERMSEGMFVFDPQGRLIDFNRAAVGMVGTPLRIGAPCKTLPAPWQALEDALAANADSCQEILVEDPAQRWYEAQSSCLQAERSNRGGHLVLVRETTDRKLLETRLESLALHDALTELYNRHYLDGALTRGIARCARTNHPLAMVMIDIDHFKQVNDGLGHSAGDTVLRALGTFLLNDVRDGDFACRYGGEEFVVILPGAGLEDAAARAESWRERFAHQPLFHGEERLHVTFSAGISAFPEHGISAEQLLQAADKALYEAKRAGRNRVHKAVEFIAEPPAAPAPYAH